MGLLQQKPVAVRTAARALAIALLLTSSVTALADSAQAPPAVGPSTFSCAPGTTITVDFTHLTVTDSVSGVAVPATITPDAIAWSYAFDSYQAGPNNSNEIVHNFVSYKLDRHTGALNGGAACAAVN